MDDLKRLYLDVFEDDLVTIKPCGRNACRRLIVSLKETYPDIDFGDSEGGWMKVDVVREYGKKLFE